MRTIHLACAGSLIVTLCAVMRWRAVGMSIGYCELAILAYVQALRTLR
jgi:hypothetical protein